MKYKPTPEILAMWRAGVLDRDVARVLGISTGAAAQRRQMAAKAGLIPVRGQPAPAVAPAEHQRIADLRGQGLTIPQIVDAVGRSESAVRRVVRQLGMGGRLPKCPRATRPRAAPSGAAIIRQPMTEAEKRAAIARHAAGESWTDIAASLGRDMRVMHQSIQRLLERDAEQARARRRANLAAAIERDNQRLAERAFRLSSGMQAEATQRRIASQMMRGARAQDAQQEAMRWHDRRRCA